MAQIDINTIEKLEKSRNTLHDKVFATYTSFEMNGKHYLQIDTYGKIDRKFQEKSVKVFSLMKTLHATSLNCYIENLIYKRI